MKLLDFGLAKAAGVAAADEELHNGGDSRTSEKKPGSATPDLFLSRTGAAMGTAGYMSPEQARGEKLDARTDLFSFGLVLYEMATGQRAFKGNTVPLLYNAIFNQAPVPARQLNREVPARLDAIISRALEKKREARYQSIAELRSDLEKLKHRIRTRRARRLWVVASAAALLVVVGTIVWFRKYAPSASPSLPDLKLTQLTDNSPENPVSGASISPDGKYLAYADLQGIHTKLIGSDESQLISRPADLKNSRVIWEIGSWFPDSKRFLVNVHQATERPDDWTPGTSSIWLVSISGGVPTKIRDHAVSYNVSPDGSWIAFTPTHVQGEQFEIEKGMWLMAPDGSKAHKFESDGDKVLCCMGFFPEDHRLGYVIQGNPIPGTNDFDDIFVTRDLNGGPATTLFRGNWGDGILLPGGKWIFTRPKHCDQAGIRADYQCNFWVERVDLSTGKVVEAARPLTKWFGFAISSFNATADGERMVFVQAYARGVSYVADLETGGTRLGNLRRVTLEEGGNDAATAWSSDGKTLLVQRSRSDRYQVSTQSLGGEKPETIVARGTGYAQASVVSPDDKWIIFQVFPLNGNAAVSKTMVPVLRVPMTGGTPETIFSVLEGGVVTCAKPPSKLCVVAETTDDLKGMTVTAFDPVKGRGSELARFTLGEDKTLGEDHLLVCDLSPDGSRFAFARSPIGPIEIYHVRKHQTHTIPISKLSPLRHIAWAADGKGVFLATQRQDGSELLHLDLHGKSEVIWKSSSRWPTWGIPSPDGRHVAIYELKQNANMFMMENF